MNYYLKKVYNIEIICPEPKYYKKVEKALRFLKHADIKSFEKVIKYLDIVFIFTKKGWYNEIRESKDAKTWGWLVEGSVFLEDSYHYQFIASELIHEAHHVIQYKSGRKYTDKQAETGAYLVQKKFLKKIEYDKAVKWLEDFYKEKWWLDKHRGGSKARIEKSKKAVKIFNDYLDGKIKVTKLK